MQTYFPSDISLTQITNLDHFVNKTVKSMMVNKWTCPYTIFNHIQSINLEE